jgi:hypothetical protein
MISKFVQPQRPEVHRWLAKKLAEEGYAAESRAEEEIVKLLESDN